MTPPESDEFDAGPLRLLLLPCPDPLPHPGRAGRKALYRLRLALKAMGRYHGWRAGSLADELKLNTPVMRTPGEGI